MFSSKLCSPIIIKMINYSLENGDFPPAWKNALVLPLLKKDGPVGNLQFVSKLAEGTVAKQLHHHMVANDLFPVLQSVQKVS